MDYNEVGLKIVEFGSISRWLFYILRNRLVLDREIILSPVYGGDGLVAIAMVIEGSPPWGEVFVDLVRGRIYVLPVLRDDVVKVITDARTVTKSNVDMQFYDDTMFLIRYAYGKNIAHGVRGLDIVRIGLQR